MKVLEEYSNIMLLSDNDKSDMQIASELIKNGDLVGIPTETVYGLGADALNPTAVKKIFQAKGRPCDNPLIVHIADIEDIEKLAFDIPKAAYKLAEKFWPGPLTMILKKRDCVPYETSGGLETVGIRMPASNFTAQLIRNSGKFIAAPSANISGYPSPTTAMHVCRDLQGKIKAVVDGGECRVGVESTVICFEDKNIRILRPGRITKDDLAEFANEVIVDSAVTEGLKDGETASSPGMKYKHYSPKANITLVECDTEKFLKFAEKNIKENECDKNCYFLAFGNDEPNSQIIYYGADDVERAKNIFALLRELDDINAKQVYIQAPSKNGVDLAVYNRLIRSAGFEVIKFE